MTLAAEEGAGARRLPAPDALESIALIVNEAAGAASLIDSAAIAGQVEEALPGAKLAAWSVAPDGLDAAMDAAFDAKPDAVLVLGGDGTARAAARRAMATQIPIAPLPGGTMNVLPKLVFGHDDLAQALTDLRQSYVTALAAGMVAGEPFFLSAAFGFAGPLAKLRETLRPPRKLKAIGSAMISAAKGLGPSLRGGVKWRRAGTRWRHAQTLVVALGSLERVLAPEEQDIETGARLQAAAIRLRSGWDIARLTGDAVRVNDWRDLNHLTLVSAQRIELELRSRRPLAVLDGEPMRLSNAQDITVLPQALPVLAARPPTAAS